MPVNGEMPLTGAFRLAILGAGRRFDFSSSGIFTTLQMVIFAMLCVNKANAFNLMPYSLHERLNASGMGSLAKNTTSMCNPSVSSTNAEVEWR